MQDHGNLRATPPNATFLRNKALIRPNQGTMVVVNVFLGRPYFLIGVALEGLPGYP